MVLFWSRQESTWGLEKTPTEIQVVSKYIHKSKAMFIFLRRAETLLCLHFTRLQVMYAQWKPHASPFFLSGNRKKNWRISRVHQKLVFFSSKNLEIQQFNSLEIQKSWNYRITKSRNPETEKSGNLETWKSRNPEIQKSRNSKSEILKLQN